MIVIIQIYLVRYPYTDQRLPARVPLTVTPELVVHQNEYRFLGNAWVSEGWTLGTEETRGPWRTGRWRTLLTAVVGPQRWIPACSPADRIVETNRIELNWNNYNVADGI